MGRGSGGSSSGPVVPFGKPSMEPIPFGSGQAIADITPRTSGEIPKFLQYQDAIEPMEITIAANRKQKIPPDTTTDGVQCVVEWNFNTQNSFVEFPSSFLAIPCQFINMPATVTYATQTLALDQAGGGATHYLKWFPLPIVTNFNDIEVKIGSSQFMLNPTQSVNWDMYMLLFAREGYRGTLVPNDEGMLQYSGWFAETPQGEYHPRWWRPQDVHPFVPYLYGEGCAINFSGTVQAGAAWPTFPNQGIALPTGQYMATNDWRLTTVDYGQYLNILYNPWPAATGLAATSNFQMADPALTGFIAGLDINPNSPICKPTLSANFVVSGRQNVLGLPTKFWNADNVHLGGAGAGAFIEWQALPNGAAQSYAYPWAHSTWQMKADNLWQANMVARWTNGGWRCGITDITNLTNMQKIFWYLLELAQIHEFFDITAPPNLSFHIRLSRNGSTSRPQFFCPVFNPFEDLVWRTNIPQAGIPPSAVPAPGGGEPVGTTVTAFQEYWNIPAGLASATQMKVISSLAYMYVTQLDLEVGVANDIQELYQTVGLPISFNTHEGNQQTLIANSLTQNIIISQWGTEMMTQVNMVIIDDIYSNSPFVPPGYYFSWAFVSQLQFNISSFSPLNNYWNTDGNLYQTFGSNYFLNQNYYGVNNIQGLTWDLHFNVKGSVYDRVVMPQTAFFGDMPGRQIVTLTCTPSGQQYHGMSPPSITGGCTIMMTQNQVWNRPKILFTVKSNMHWGLLCNDTCAIDAYVPSTLTQGGN